MISGQVIIRDAMEGIVPGGKRRLVMIFGVITIPENSELKSEHQYPIYGDGIANTLRIAEEQGVDVTDKTLGSTPDALLRQPMWRV